MKEPVSAQHHRPNVARGGPIDAVLAVVASLIMYSLGRNRDWSDTELAIAVTVSVSAMLSVAEYCRVNRGVPWPSMPAALLARRALRHWIEAMIGLALVIGFWWLLLAEYGRPEYAPLWVGLGVALPILPPAILAVIVFTEMRLGMMRDIGTPLVSLISSCGRLTDAEALRQAVLVLLVRAIFLPLNFCVLVRCFEHLRGREAYVFSASWPEIHANVLIAIYALLIATILPGYIFSSRLLDTQPREVDTSLLGWAATLVCYRPLSLAVFDRWLNYHGRTSETIADRPWVDLTSPWPMLFALIAVSIIVLELVHLWAEASFGLRASNLTNRGIIVHGPYRYSKHPIYVAKCAGWLLMFLPPFAGQGLSDAFRSTMLFVGVCILFAVRAYAEERLLARDPVYVAYALSMDDRGVFGWVGRIFPALTFRHRRSRWKADGMLR